MSATIDGSATESLEFKFEGFKPEQLLQWADEEFGQSLAVSTSFGIQSAVTLHLATSVNPGIPVIWVDTGYLPEETYQYVTTLSERLNLNLHVFRSQITPAEMESRYGRLWESERVSDLDLYDQIRKVEPMERALQQLNVRGWVSGLRAQQTDFRQQLPRVKRSGSRYRIYPILKWDSRDVYRYMQRHDLPQHPLFDQGYTTIGDAHSSRPLGLSDASDRDTRFRGMKQECGIHTN